MMTIKMKYDDCGAEVVVFKVRVLPGTRRRGAKLEALDH
jgi:hypothetical protein